MTPFGDLNIVQIPMENRMELKVEYPRPIDKPQVGDSQDIKGTWKWDKAFFAGWKFTRERTMNMKPTCVGLMIDPDADEAFVGHSRDAWFQRRLADNSSWSVKAFPPWEDHVIPSLHSHDDNARRNRVHMMGSHEYYCQEFGLTMVNRKCPVPPGVRDQRESSRVTRLLPVRDHDKR
jgi:hypothetical protein